MKRLLAFAGLIALATTAVAGGPEENATSPRQESEVGIHAEYDTYSDAEGYGFVLIISKWEPHAAVEVHIVGPRGEILTIVSPDSSILASEKGRVTVFVPYSLTGLYPGNWQLVVAGKNGIHQAEIEIPASPRDRLPNKDGT